jgi:hypothetical protein
MAKLEDSFDMFDDATEPRSKASTDRGPGAEKPAGPSVNGSQGKRPAKPAQSRQHAETPAQPPADLDPATRNLWRTLLQNSARKLARDRQQVAASEAAWPSSVAQARALGVPEHVILEAAAGANVEVPE